MSAPWLAHYDPGVPATLAPYPDRTLVDYVAEAARTRPHSPALLFKGATVTYGQLDRLSDAWEVGAEWLRVRSQFGPRLDYGVPERVTDQQLQLVLRYRLHLEGG